jgi:hypothetical protein
LGRLIVIVLICCTLPACAVVTTVAAIPGAVLQGYNYFIKGQDTGIPRSMRASLAIVQQGLRKVDMDADVLEPLPDGYAITFGGSNLDGKIKLTRATEHLTTITVSVRKGALHQKSIEQAILSAIKDTEPTTSSQARFQFANYVPLLQHSQKNSARIAWYRRGSYAEIKPAKLQGWLELKLPSGNKAYLRGHLTNAETSANITRHQAMEE